MLILRIVVKILETYEFLCEGEYWSVFKSLSHKQYKEKLSGYNGLYSDIVTSVEGLCSHVALGVVCCGICVYFATKLYY